MNFILLILCSFVESPSLLWILILFNLISFIFTAIGLYRISKDRGYIGNHKSWFAIVPVIQLYLMGAVADNINMLSRKKTNYRIVFLVLYVLNWILKIIIRTMNSNTRAYLKQNQLMAMGFIFFITVATIAIATTSLVYMYICLYQIYKDYASNHANMYIVLSIVFGISPFILFAIKNKPSVSMYYAQQNQQQQYNYNNQQ